MECGGDLRLVSGPTRLALPGMEQVLGRLEIIRKYVNNHNHKATRTVTTYLLFVHAKRRFYIGYGTDDDDDKYVSAYRTIPCASK